MFLYLLFLAALDRAYGFSSPMAGFFCPSSGQNGAGGAFTQIGITNQRSGSGAGASGAGGGGDAISTDPTKSQSDIDGIWVTLQLASLKGLTVKDVKMVRDFERLIRPMAEKCSDLTDFQQWAVQLAKKQKENQQSEKSRLQEFIIKWVEYDFLGVLVELLSL